MDTLPYDVVKSPAEIVWVPKAELLVHERLNEAPAVDSTQFRVIFDPSDVAEKLVGAAKDTTTVVATELTEFSSADNDWRVIV